MIKTKAVLKFVRQNVLILSCFYSGKELINHRQKLIRIADEAEMGWKVVQEYDAHPLADDSEDEKRLYRAESRVNRKSKAEKAKRRPTRRYNPYRPAAT